MRVALIVISASALLLASASQARASIEAGEGGGVPSFDFENLTDRIETIMNQVTEQPAQVEPDTAAQNVAAFLSMIGQSEGTANAPDPYAVCYGYQHTIRNFADHPAITREWMGERLPDAMCRNAGFGPGCVSTAAGKFQIIKPTWVTIARAMGLRDFSPASQDAAAVDLIKRRGALEDVKAGRIGAAIVKCKNEWASLPGNYAKQGQRSIGDLIAWYQQNGGNQA